MSVKVHHIADLIMTWRQCGHTTTIFDASKDKEAVLLVSNTKYGEQLLKKHGVRGFHNFRIVSYQAIPSDFNYRFDGHKELPMIIDNSFLLAYAQDVDLAINQYRKKQQDDFTKINNYLEQLDSFRKGREYVILSSDNVRLRYKVAQQEYQNSMLAVKYKMKEELLRLINEKLATQPYFLVPLTLFLTFYFLMAVYLLTYFLR